MTGGGAGVGRPSRSTTPRQRSGWNSSGPGHGGDRLAEIETQIGGAGVGRRPGNGAAALRGAAGRRRPAPGLVEPSSSPQRQAEITAGSDQAAQELADWQNQAAETSVELATIHAESNELRAELASLQQRRSSIPRESLALRAQLSQALKVAEADLPFAGELIAVRAEHAEWEGAAERVLHGFALSLLVPDQHYAAVSGWINEHHLGTRLVYYRVLTPHGPAPRATVDPGVLPLYAVLEIKQPSAFYSWLEARTVQAGRLCLRRFDAGVPAGAFGGDQAGTDPAGHPEREG